MSTPPTERKDVVIVGAGFAGLYALHRLRALGLDCVVLDAAGGVGGTWYWNRYPGCRCDVQSLEYSYSFSEELQQEWHWTERYATQPEIERYANHVADRFDLRRDIRLTTRVSAARFEGDSNRWTVTVPSGTITARFLIMATGGYSAPVEPKIPGLEDFEGERYYTAKWPDEPVSFRNKRIGIVGTGSSGMQTATAIAAQDPKHLYVFQRTANFCVPAQNVPMDPETERAYKRQYRQHREAARDSAFGVVYPVGGGDTAALSDEEFEARMGEAWEFGGAVIMAAFPDIHTDIAANNRVAEYVRQRLRERVVDPNVADLITPRGHYIGARRLLVETGYPEIFNQPNVSLVDVRSDPIMGVTPDGVRTERSSYPLDMLILATGFDSGTGAVTRIELTGLDGETIHRHWADGPTTFLGMTVASFPNLFMLWGPGSPGLRSHGILLSELQVDWLADLIGHMDENGYEAVDTQPEAETTWTAHVAEVAASGIHMKVDTQYVGANIPGKPRVYLAYLGGVGFYRRLCQQIAADGYSGLRFRTAVDEVDSKEPFVCPSLDAIRVSAI